MSYWAPYFRKNSTVAWYFLISPADVAGFTTRGLPVYFLTSVISEVGFLAIVLRKCGDLRFQLRTVFADHPGDVASLVDHQVFPWFELLENFCPQQGLIPIDDDNADESRMDHFQQIVVLQILRRGFEDDRRLLLFRESLVEIFEMSPVARRFADEHFLAGKIVERCQFGRRWSRHRDLPDAAEERLAEIDLFEAFRRDRQDAGCNVAASLQQPRDQLVAASSG